MEYSVEHMNNHIYKITITSNTLEAKFPEKPINEIKVQVF